MAGISTAEAPQEFCYVLLRHFSMLAFTGAIEPLRAANSVSGLDFYRWRLASIDGQPVTASNGIPLVPDCALDEVERPDLILICAGMEPMETLTPPLINWLRRKARHGVPLAGIGTGAYAMAKAGLLDGYRCTVHWENMAGFQEIFPRLHVTANLFEIDRDRITCAGGTASLDLLLHLIGEQHGGDLRAAVSEWFLHTMARPSDAPQRMELRQRVGVSHSRLLAAIAEIEANIAEPLSRADLADRVGISARQLERLFRVHLDCTPSRYYLDVRLKRAKILLSQTSLSILEIAVACGFASASHFAKCYRAAFGRPPRQERADEVRARRSGVPMVSRAPAEEEEPVG
ncbi:MAG: GlxA family transcriptional regulator [Rhodospirillaceae bacterium]|nr:GlxA family transcriptional regulator [Rhodospirillaceae bacterium]